MGEAAEERERGRGSCGAVRAIKDSYWGSGGGRGQYTLTGDWRDATLMTRVSTSWRDEEDVEIRETRTNTNRHWEYIYRFTLLLDWIISVDWKFIYSPNLSGVLWIGGQYLIVSWTRGWDKPDVMFVASVREMENESKTITNPFISILIKLFQIKIKPFPSVQRIQHNNPPGTEGPKLLYTFIMPEMKWEGLENRWVIEVEATFLENIRPI